MHYQTLNWNLPSYHSPDPRTFGEGNKENLPVIWKLSKKELVTTSIFDENNLTFKVLFIFANVPGRPTTFANFSPNK